MMKYVKIAALLPEKTVRDVALRCRWMAVSFFFFLVKIKHYLSIFEALLVIELVDDIHILWNLTCFKKLRINFMLLHLIHK